MHVFCWALLAGSAHADGPMLLSEMIGSRTDPSDEFGASAGLSGSIAVFGAPREGSATWGVNAGAAYVFEENPDGTWTETARLEGSQYTQWYGDNLAIDGETIVVGSQEDAAFVYERSGGTWVEHQVITASDAPRAFGDPVALSGETLVVGAPYRDNDTGAVYVYERDPVSGQFTEVDILVASTGVPGTELGAAVAIAGEVIAAVSDWDDTVTVFERDAGSGLFVETATLSPADGTGLSAAVAVDGDTLVVGSMWVDDWDGAAYVFERDPLSGAWVETQRLVDPWPTGYANFGYAVALEGDTLAVTAQAVYDTPGGGSTVVFERRAGTFSVVAKVYPPDPDDENNFGNGVGLSNGRLAIGARHTDYLGANGGAGYVFALVPTQIAAISTGPDTWQFEVSGLTPFAPAVALTGTLLGEGTVASGHCAGTALGIADAKPWRRGVADAWGTGTFERLGVPAPAYVQVVDKTTCAVSDVITVP